MEVNRLFFLSCRFTELLRKQRPLALVSFSLLNQPPQDSLSFCVTLQPSIDPDKNSEFRTQIDMKRTYCVETHLSFHEKDSVTLIVSIDGVPAWSCSSAYPHKNEYLDIQATNSFSGYRAWELFLDDVAISSKRIFAIPDRPMVSGHKNEDTVILQSEPFTSTFNDESQKASEWQFFLESNPDFPIFHFRESDPFYFNRCALPFPPDSGSYWWRVRHKNNFGCCWSDWLRPDTLTVTAHRNQPAILKDIYLAQENSAAPLASIIPETWYDLHIRLKPNIPWYKLAYLIIILHHTDFSFGSPANKGGPFIKDSNYIVNLSLYDKKFILFEKNRDHSHFSERIKPDQPGLYLNAPKKRILVDTTTGKIQLRVKLLSEVIPGKWALRAFLFDSVNTMSNMITASIQVEPKAETGGMMQRCIGLTLILFIGTITFMMFRRKKSRIAPFETSKSEYGDAEFQRIVTYLHEHISEKNSTTDIQKALKIGKNRFFSIMQQNNSDYSKLLNSIRIKRAKELLSTSSKSISEIGFAVGFSNPAYFSKVFKEIEDLTPTEYIKQQSR
jgi:AraC-like DNA-binding protein